jgi:hypothetical protein
MVKRSSSSCSQYQSEDRFSRLFRRGARARRGAPPRPLGQLLLGDVAPHAAVAAEAAVLVEQRLAADRDEAQAPVAVVAAQLQVAERPACRQIVLVPRALLVRFEQVAQLEARLADRAWPAQSCALVVALGDVGEAQILVLLPVPVGRECGKAAEAVGRFHQLHADAATLGRQARHQQRRQGRDDPVGEQMQETEQPGIVPERPHACSRSQRGDGQRDGVGQPDPAQAQVHGRQQRHGQAQVRAGAGLEQEHVDIDQHLQQRQADAFDGAHAARLAAARSRPRQHQGTEQEHAERVAPPADGPRLQGLPGGSGECEQDGSGIKRGRDDRREEAADPDQGKHVARPLELHRESRSAAEQPRTGERRGRAACARCQRGGKRLGGGEGGAECTERHTGRKPPPAQKQGRERYAGRQPQHRERRGGGDQQRPRIPGGEAGCRHQGEAHQVSRPGAAGSLRESSHGFDGSFWFGWVTPRGARR